MDENPYEAPETLTEAAKPNREPSEQIQLTVQRPRSVSIVCWFLIVLCGLSLIGGALFLRDLFDISNSKAQRIMESSPIPTPIQIVLMFVGPIVVIVASIVMYKGTNWGRWLYIVWNVLGSAVSLVVTPNRLLALPGIGVFLICCLFLISPKANEFFRVNRLNSTSAPPASDETEARS